MRKMLAIMLAILLALSAVSAFAAKYTDKDTVKKVQQALNDAGYDCGTPDGIAGKKTYAAATSYQTDKGLTVTGVIDDELLVALGLAEEEAADHAPAEGDTAEGEEAAAAGEGYTFQGIPWGSSPDETNQDLVESGLIDTNSFSLVEGNSIYYPEDENTTEFSNLVILGNTVKDVGGFCWIREGINKTIAGHEVSGIKLGYLYDVADDRILPDLGLSMVVIEYDYYNEEIFRDITSKLSDSYGKYEEFKYEGEIPVHIWRGADDTVICLINNYGYNTMVYAKADAYKQVQQIQTMNDSDKATDSDAGL